MQEIISEFDAGNMVKLLNTSNMGINYMQYNKK